MTSEEPGTDWTCLLPNETLIEIFAPIHALQIEHIEADLEDEAQDFTDTIIPLTRVCRRWREVIYHEPRFWAHIKVTAKHTSLETIKQLQRSKGRRLYIFWSCHAADTAGSSERKIWEALVGELTRCQELTIVGRREKCLERLALCTNALPRALPCLSSLRIFVPVSYGRTLHWPRDPLMAHPVRAIRLFNCDLATIGCNGEFLTTLELAYGADTEKDLGIRVPESEFNRLFNEMPALTYLNLSGDCVVTPSSRAQFDPSPDLPPCHIAVKLPSLHTLVLQAYGPDCDYLTWICAPNLRLLVLAHLSSYLADPTSRNDVARNFPSLEVLKLINISTELDDQISALPFCFPHLTTLSITHTNWAILYNLGKHPGLGGPGTWPLLQKFITGPAVPPSDIMNFISLRRRSGHPLSTISTDEEGSEMLKELWDDPGPELEIQDLAPPVEYDIGLQPSRYVW
ncbi:hypothetical protein BDN72DRAFT_894564 [Pluteus cervinus]|uniref:Uncharacterized protein n=1 Tax=Pluteus cervinus TaxID=181527 RepID=A0ACD3B4L2_9AGAR|nr:hypothetical protein BDN72DRAFT_894564 [Pluteus cervinus]